MRLLFVSAFYALRVGSALVLLKLSAIYLPVAGFTIFAQLMQFAALLNVLALCGAQSGIIRQAAAAPDLDTLVRTQGAAMAIWAAVSPLALLATGLGGGSISTILTGAPNAHLAIFAIAAIVVMGAPGGIWCAMLTGRKRVGQSLSVQAAGMLAGVAGAAWRIRLQDPVGATLAFAAGPLVTAGMALPFLLRLGLPPVSREGFGWRPVRDLLRYSTAIAATTGGGAITTFGLRWIYRQRFGVTSLGYWLAANRVSDMSTQLVGLFLIQTVVPQLAMTNDEMSRRRFLLWSWIAATGAMVAFLLVFTFGWGPLIHVFLSDAYRPAAAVIAAYMAGDVLRVWSSLAMHAAFARGEPLRYAGIEIVGLGAMAVITTGLVLAGDRAAPQIGYIASNGLAAVAITLAFLLRRRFVTGPETGPVTA